MTEKKENLFPTLSEVASRTDALRDVEDDDVRLNDNAPALVDQEEGEEREMHEVESFCMRCHDNVSRSNVRTDPAGNNTTTSHLHPIL